MRILQIIKTGDGAKWAVDQVRELCGLGIEVHVAIPTLDGRLADDWRRSGATLHAADLDLPVRQPWRLVQRMRRVRDLVDRIAPDLIHSHFFGPTLVMRYALGADHPVPRLFQVPGPLHLEHRLYRSWELSTAGPRDFWVPSSRYIRGLYRRAGVSPDRLFLSYYGNERTEVEASRSTIREELGIGTDALVVGNINYMYPPKYYLGQTKGLKRHEDVIDALGLALEQRSDLYGVLIGGQWGAGNAYEQRLRRRAQRAAGGRILMPGRLEYGRAGDAWAGFDLAIHVPTSENCGGVVEPLLAAVPVVASRTGGLPELVIDQVTGRLVEDGEPRRLAGVIEEVLDDLPRYREMASTGRRLVKEMFDVRRTAAEIAAVYRHLTDDSPYVPPEFDSKAFVNGTRGHG